MGAIGPLELIVVLFIFVSLWPHWVLSKQVGWSPLLTLLLLVPPAGFVFAVLLVWRALTLAAYSRALIILLLVPLINLILVFWLAFADWPQARPPQSSATLS